MESVGIKRNGDKRRGKPRREWIDNVKNVLTARCIDIQQEREWLHDRSEWQYISMEVGCATNRTLEKSYEATVVMAVC